MRHWPANDTVRYQLLLLQITRKTAVDMAVTAAKMLFDKSQHVLILRPI